MKQRTLKLDDGTIVYCYEDGSVEWFVKGPYQRTRRSFGARCVQDYRGIKINGKNYRIHRLIATAFLPNPNNLPEVDHINRNKADNRPENLRWADDYIQSNNRSFVDNCIRNYGFRRKDNPKLYTLLYNRNYYKVKNPRKQIHDVVKE